MEAFSIFSLVLSSYFPHHWKDLTQYKLLILRFHRHFSGKVWLNYDRVFREHAAATKLIDWSSMNVQLSNFHAAGSSTRGPSYAQPSGSSFSSRLCKSWYRGRCTAPVNPCRYAHRCSLYSGSQVLSWKELCEVMLDVEIAINSRALSYVEEDIEQPLLTPNLFLFQRSNQMPELETHHLKDVDLRKRARYLRKCKQALWSR